MKKNYKTKFSTILILKNKISKNNLKKIMKKKQKI
jgi:arsenate reductase-like glutaredoxin family protein